MPFYKDKNNELHFIDNEEFESLLPNYCIKISEEEAKTLQRQPLNAEQITAAVTAARAAAYIAESDPLFFKAQRGEATNEEWLAKIAEIKARFPDGVLPA